MSQSDCCPRCGITETTRHLLLDCIHAKNIWNLYNLVVKEDKVNKYEDLFKIGDSQCEIMIKMKIIQELIQIDRPRNWDRERLVNVIKNLMDIEKYNSIKDKKIEKYKKIWNKYENIE
jgi:predicted nucleic-acid-binding protein